MKKILLTLICAVMCSVSAEAQVFKAITDFAKDTADELTDGKASEVINKITGAATEIMLEGTWNYNAPAIRFDSEDALATAAGAALNKTISTKLQKAYDLVGIKQGSCSYTFNSDGTFSATIGNRTHTGKYTYNSETHALVLEYDSKLLKLGTMEGYAYLSENGLDLVFDCTRLVNFVVKLGAKTSMLKGVTTLLSSYDSVMLGYGLTR